jgi:hypothetical protein
MDNPSDSPIQQFSKHLFWDMDKSKMDLNASKKQIIYQVVEYGQWEDWNLLRTLYTPEEIIGVVTCLPSLDVVTLSFLAHYYDLDKNLFRCYKPNASVTDFWKS